MIENISKSNDKMMDDIKALVVTELREIKEEFGEMKSEVKKRKSKVQDLDDKIQG